MNKPTVQEMMEHPANTTCDGCGATFSEENPMIKIPLREGVAVAFEDESVADLDNVVHLCSTCIRNAVNPM